MFLNLNAADYRDQWTGYILTDVAGKCFHVGIVRMVDVTALSGVEFPAGTTTFYLTLLDNDVDRLKLANRMISEMPRRGLPEYQWTVQEIVRSWSHGNRRYGKPVRCIETGEQWNSLTDCAKANKISYSALQKHLNDQIGYKTVKGRTYRKG